ncbi:MAG TPA: MFS transporter [Roseiflexaceae bacterium]|nr:MFS transporter [Roseiflexaceae bacterium]
MAITATDRVPADGTPGPVVNTVDAAIERIGVGRFQWRLLFVNGLVWAADAMEVLLAGFVLPAIALLWALSPAQVGLVGTATFAGMFIGAWAWGIIADRIGRRAVFVWTVLLGALFSLLAAVSPDLNALLLARFLTGLAIGGTLPVDYAVMSEFLPARQRGRFLVYLESFWSLGTIAVALLAWLLIPRFPEDGWRWLLAISALPGLLGFWIRRNVPESPRYLLVSGREEEARRVLERVAADNGVALRVGQLQAEPRSARSSTAVIWSAALRSRTALLSLVWFGLSLGYYGIFTWLPSIFVQQGFTFVRSYEYLILLAVAQVPGYALAAYLVDRIGRRWTVALFLAISAASSFLFALAATPTLIVGSAMLMSFALLGAWGGLYAFTPELYPTEVRATGMGWASAMARAAGILAPTVGGLLLGASLPLALGIYAAFFVLAAVAALLIRDETAGRELADVVES